MFFSFFIFLCLQFFAEFHAFYELLSNVLSLNYLFVKTDNESHSSSIRNLLSNRMVWIIMTMSVIGESNETRIALEF